MLTRTDSPTFLKRLSERYQTPFNRIVRPPCVILRLIEKKQSQVDEHMAAGQGWPEVSMGVMRTKFCIPPPTRVCQSEMSGISPSRYVSKIRSVLNMSMPKVLHLSPKHPHILRMVAYV